MRSSIENKQSITIIIVQDVLIKCVALVEEIPEIVAFGSTIEEAKKNIYFELNRYELTNGSLNINTIQYKLVGPYSYN